MKRLFKPLEDIGDDSIIHIIHGEQDRLEAICDYGYEDLVPLTPAEWWKFAPWQDMKDAPKTGELIIIMTDNNDFFVSYWNHQWCFDGVSKAIKWLPLPAGDL